MDFFCNNEKNSSCVCFFFYTGQSNDFVINDFFLMNNEMIKKKRGLVEYGIDKFKQKYGVHHSCFVFLQAKSFFLELLSSILKIGMRNYVQIMLPLSSYMLLLLFFSLKN